MNATIHVETKRYIRCTECNHPSYSWGHLKPGQTFGPWYCDECGHAIRGVATAHGADIESAPDRKIRTLVLLRLYDQLNDGMYVHIVVEGMTFVKPGEEPNFEHDEYHYNERTCPWNYLRLPIKAGDDSDPHGVFVHQETILLPDGYDGSIDGDWCDLFPSLIGD